MHRDGSLRLLATALLPAALAVAVAFAVLAPEPYMDEPFHVPQTQRYCRGRWREWDPKITTFPGLYVFGAALGRAVHAAQRLLWHGRAGTACGTAVLRAVPLAFGAACLPLFLAVARELDPSRSERQAALTAAACFLFPLHFFFCFLYYTDVPSLFFTLAAYLASRQRRGLAAGGLAAAAVLMRQTNAVWVAWMLGAALLDRCLPDGGGRSSGSGSSSRRGGRAGQRGSGGSAGGRGPLPELRLLAAGAWRQRRQLAAELWPLAAVVAAFAAFVVANGGVVVGDRDHHAPVRHLAQPLYCLLYCSAWLAPVLWTPAAVAATARAAAAAAARAPAAAAAAAAAGIAAAAAAVSRGTLAHPFLLADNRHYAFYVWRRLLNATPWSRYALLPAYLYAGCALGGRLAHRGALWLALLAGAACVVLVPAHLLEPRYFTTPFLLALLHMRPPSPRALAATVALFAAADAAALYAFLARPFAWPDGSVARFMW